MTKQEWDYCLSSTRFDTANNFHRKYKKIMFKVSANLFACCDEFKKGRDRYFLLPEGAAFNWFQLEGDVV